MSANFDKSPDSTIAEYEAFFATILKNLDPKERADLEKDVNKYLDMKKSLSADMIRIHDHCVKLPPDQMGAQFQKMITESYEKYSEIYSLHKEIAHKLNHLNRISMNEHNQDQQNNFLSQLKSMEAQLSAEEKKIKSNEAEFKKKFEEIKKKLESMSPEQAKIALKEIEKHIPDPTLLSELKKHYESSHRKH